MSENVSKITPLNESYEFFTDVEGAIFYLDPPYEGTAGYNKDDARKLSKEKYTELRNRLLQLPAGSEIIEDDIVAHLGTSANNQNRMYYKDLRVKNNFDSKAFYEWTYQMSKNNIVLLSSYTVSDERFEEVYRFEKAKSTYNTNFTGECEKSFMVKNTVN